MKKSAKKGKYSDNMTKAGMAPPVSMSQPKSVRIEKAGNGYTVCQYTDGGEKKMVAKSEVEAMRHAKDMLK